MNSITTVVKVRYGHNDEPEPLFQCPVEVDPQVLQVFQVTPNRVETIVAQAACAIELVGRFEGACRYVDFAPTLALGDLPIALRAQLMQGHVGNVVRIDLADIDRRARP